VVSKGHLQGLTILDTNKFDIILAPWIEKKFINHLKNKLRSYDKLSKLQEHVFIILASDTDYNGLRGLDKRLRKEYGSFFQGLKEIGISKGPKIIHCGIAVTMKNNSNQKKMVFDYIREWIYEQIQKECREDKLLKYTFYDDGPEIEW